jgi:hypothetical protein
MWNDDASAVTHLKRLGTLHDMVRRAFQPPIYALFYEYVWISSRDHHDYNWYAPVI